jgi:hypothetical protein
MRIRRKDCRAEANIDAAAAYDHDGAGTAEDGQRAPVVVLQGTKVAYAVPCAAETVARPVEPTGAGVAADIKTADWSVQTALVDDNDAEAVHFTWLRSGCEPLKRSPQHWQSIGPHEPTFSKSEGRVSRERGY